MTRGREYARTAYQDETVATRYEADRYASPMGRWRWAAEQRGVADALRHAPARSRHVLDCPTGIGRWRDVLRSAFPSALVVGVDVSAQMLRRARAGGPVVRGDVESLPVRDRSADVVFCHALMKHLEPEEQARAFAELARVAADTVVCSFSVLHGIPGVLWRLRRPSGAVAVTPRWLAERAGRAGFTVAASYRCSTPVGIERAVVFQRLDRRGAGEQRVGLE